MVLPLRPIEEYGRLSQLIGTGAFGEVYLTDHGYVVKKISNLDGVITSTTLNEISALLGVNSPYVLPLIDVYLERDWTYLVLPLADAALNSVLGDPELNPRDLTRQLCLGLAEMQNSGFLHHDLKPENLLLRKTSTYQLWIADLGLTKPYFCALPPQHEMRFSLYYRSPENSLDGLITPKGDVWSVGVIVADLLLSQERSAETYLFDLIDRPGDDWLAWREFKTELPEQLSRLRLGQEEIDFITFILEPDPEQRPSIFDLLNHPWLALPRLEKLDELPCYQLLRITSKTPANRWPKVAWRSLTLDWLLNLQKELFVTNEALALAVYVLDTLFTQKSITAEQIQSYALASFYLGALYYPNPFIPDLGDLTFLTKISRDEIQARVEEILASLGFNLNVATSYLFLSLYLRDYPERKEEVTMIWSYSLFLPSHFNPPEEVAVTILSFLDPQVPTTHLTDNFYQELEQLPEKYKKPRSKK